MTNAEQRLQEFIDGERFNLKPTDLREVLASLHAAEEALRQLHDDYALYVSNVEGGYTQPLIPFEDRTAVKAAAALLQGADKASGDVR